VTNDHEVFDQAIVVVAHYRAQEGAQDTVAALLAEYSRLVLAEPGCAAFSAHQAYEDPREFVLCEQYHDRTAFDQHCASPHYLSIARDRIRPLLEHRDVTLYRAALGP
jgi:quinol monooxygenase YgiN